MARDPIELVVGNSGGVNVAAVGTVVADDLEPLDTGDFAEFGYITEDGVTVRATPDISEVRAWQSRSPIRRDLNAQDASASFTLLQWNEETSAFALGGASVTSPAAGIYKVELPEEGDPLDERCLVIDVVDGEFTYRWVIPRGNVAEAVESNFRRQEPGVLPITFNALEPTGGGSPMYLLTDDPSFAAGS